MSDDARDFNNIGTRAVIKYFLQGKSLNQIHAILTETLACFLSGRAKDLSAPLYLTNELVPWIRVIQKVIDCTIIQYKPTKCTFSKYFNFTVSSICFEPETSFSERRLYVQLLYSTFTYISISGLVGVGVEDL